MTELNFPRLKCDLCGFDRALAAPGGTIEGWSRLQFVQGQKGWDEIPDLFDLCPECRGSMSSWWRERVHKCKKLLRNLIVVCLFLPAAANAQELIPFQLVIKVNPALALAFNPSAPSIACNIPGGTVVAAITSTGGDGNPITLGITGDTTDFALSSTTLPANVIVASGGITSASGKCPITTPVTETVTISASQP